MKPDHPIAERILRLPGIAFLAWHVREFRQQQAMRRFYAQFIHPGDRCFDIGANVGNRTSVFVRLGALVTAVDPQPACIAALKNRFKSSRRVTLVEAGLDEREGTHEMLVGNESTIASMSREWIDRVKQTGRFGTHTWDRVMEVPVTTLDALIAQFGRPAFIKVDVEGFELPVLRGLTQPVRMISFEFTPENMENVALALRHLAGLGRMVCNYSLGESMDLALRDWCAPEELIARLRGLNDALAWGDVYVRFQDEAGKP